MKSIFKKAIITISLTFLIPLLGHSQSWSILGSGATALKANYEIFALAADPAGNIYAAGNFRNNAGYPYVAKWNGTTWTELEGTNSLQPGAIYSLISDPLGNIYAGGSYSNGIGGFLAKWDGTNWTNLNESFNSPYNSFLTITSDNMGNVYTAVYDTTVVNSDRMYVVKWNGNNWSTLGAFPPDTYISSVVADGNGNIYASAIDTTNFHYFVTKWDGNNWSTLGASTNLISSSQIFSLHIDNSDNLYARAGELVAKWINNDWVKLGTGSTPLDNGAGPQICTDLEGNVYATAPFLTFDYKVQKWDGSNWYPAGFVNGADYTFNGPLSTIISDQLGNIYTAGTASDSLGYYYVAKYTQSHTSPIHSVDKLDQSLNMYPNPSTGDIFIELTNDHPSLKISIFNILGQVVQSYAVPNNGLKSPFKINVRQLANSQYMLQITGNNVNLSRRFTKG